MAIKSHEEGDLEIDCADFGFDTDCTGNVARSNVVHVMKEMKEREDSWKGCPLFLCIRS